MADSNREHGQAERNSRALAAAAGALAGLRLGPAGLVGGAALAPMLEPAVSEVIRRIGNAGQRRGAQTLAQAVEICGVPAQDTLARIFTDEKYQLLAATAVVAAMRTTWEDKIRTLGRSLASGLLARDDAEVDAEQLIMSAIGDLEGPHVTLLDLLVAWEPASPATADSAPRGVGIPGYSHSSGAWNPGNRKWAVTDIRAARPRLAPVMYGLLGTLQRHGLAFMEPSLQINSIVHADTDDEPLLQTKGRNRAARSGRGVSSTASELAQWEPTELGEQVWLRFHEAGTTIPDAWLANPPDANGRT